MFKLIFFYKKVRERSLSKLLEKPKGFDLYFVDLNTLSLKSLLKADAFTFLSKEGVPYPFRHAGGE